MFLRLRKFSHEHPLIFISEGTKGNTSDEQINRVCNGCTLPIFSGSPFYTCQECDKFSLHKTCAELPRKLKYQHNHGHFWRKSHNCYSCGNSVEHKSYYKCNACYLILDTICAFSHHPTELSTIQHRGHPRHPLKLLGIPALLLCYACGEEHRGHFYTCHSCHFYIHQDCASFPSTTKPGDPHVHSLALSYTAPDAYDPEEDTCVICRKSCKTRFWMYWCSKCRYAVHLKCAMSKIEPFMSILLPRGIGYKSDTQIADRDDVIRLPPANEFVSVVGHLTTSTSYGNVEDPAALREVNDLICHHQHPLDCVDDKSSSSIVESFLFGPDKNYFSSVPQCDVCFRAISTPFYCCKICKLFFHQMCSKLPSQIQHPLHLEHPLIPLPRHPSEFFGIFRCKICKERCNGICYVCRTCEISLDVKCALLPRNIIHEAHPHHVLTLGDNVPSQGSNNCCTYAIYEDLKGYTCDTCDFGMHADCALYPSTARDTCDQHELKLIYDPSQANSDEYYCLICEYQIDQRYWFYHCVECDRSFHIWCRPPDDHQSFRITAIPSIGYHPNLKFGVTGNFKIHPHPLMFVHRLEGSSCNYCGDSMYPAYYGLAFECSECNYIIHLDCCKKYETSDPETLPPTEKTCTKL